MYFTSPITSIQSPEYLLLESPEKLCNHELSPKPISRLPKFKLNLDISENERSFEQAVKNSNSKLNEQLMDTSCDNRPITSKMNILYNSTALDESSLTLIPKSLSTKLAESKIYEFEFNSPNSLKSASSVINLPIVSNCNTLSEDKTYFNESLTKSYYSFFYKWYYPTSFEKVAILFDWVTHNVVTFMQKNYKRICNMFSSKYTINSRNEDKLTNVISIIRTDNQNLLSKVEKKLTSIMQELSQIRITSDETLSVLKKEVDILKNTNKTLIDNNESLTMDLQSITCTLKNIQINSDVPEVQKPIRSISVTKYLTPPPPPPPLPPPPIPLSFTTTPTTPRSGRKCRSSKTPTRKSSLSVTLGDERPVITVEELLKVTLKKAPQKNKENGKTPQGPIVSLDMLKNVKLKSARRRSFEKTARSPLRTLKDGSQRFSLSPIKTGAVSLLI